MHTYVDGSTTTVYRDGRMAHYTPAVAKEDYVDKAFGMASKKLGFHLSRGEFASLGATCAKACCL